MFYFLTFLTSFRFAILHLLVRCVKLPQGKQHLLEGKSYLSGFTFSLATPACISSGCIAIDYILASSMAWVFPTTFSSVRFGSCSEQRRKRLDKHLSMNWSHILLFGLANSHVDAILRSFVTKLSDDSFVPCIAWRKTCLSNTTFFLGSKWLCKASIAALPVVPTSCKCPLHVAQYSEVVMLASANHCPYGR